MPRYIDGDFTIEELYKKYKNAKGEARKAYSDAIDIVIAQGDKDVQEVKHGTWTNKRTMLHDGETYCSLCDWEADVKFKYCPNCGARMDGDEK